MGGDCHTLCDEYQRGSARLNRTFLIFFFASNMSGQHAYRPVSTITTLLAAEYHKRKTLSSTTLYIYFISFQPSVSNNHTPSITLLSLLFHNREQSCTPPTECCRTTRLKPQNHHHYLPPSQVRNGDPAASARWSSAVLLRFSEYSHYG